MDKLVGVALGRSSAGVAVFCKSSNTFTSVKRVVFRHPDDSRIRMDAIKDQFQSIQPDTTHSVGLYELSNSLPRSSSDYNKNLELIKLHGLLTHDLESLFGKNRVVPISLRQPFQLFKIKGPNNDSRSKLFELVRSSLGSILPLHLLPGDKICPTNFLLSDAVGACAYLSYLQNIADLKTDTAELSRLREEALQSKMVRELQQSILSAKSKIVTLEIQEVLESRIDSVVAARLAKKALKKLPLSLLS